MTSQPAKMAVSLLASLAIAFGSFFVFGSSLLTGRGSQASAMVQTSQELKFPRDHVAQNVPSAVTAASAVQQISPRRWDNRLEQRMMRRQAAAARIKRKLAREARAAAAAAAARKAAARKARRAKASAPSLAAAPAGTAQQIAMGMLGSYGWDSSQFGCLDSLWNMESGWRWNATNPSSGAFGIPQALPGSKMASAGSDWQTNPATQIKWGLGYIRSLYGSPCGAWAHEQADHWY